VNVISQFKKVAIAEGISYLILLFVAMPLRTFGGYPLFVKYFGWAHGMLFIWFMLLLAILFFGKTWNFKKCFTAGIASLVPFGTFWFDRKYLSKVSL